MSGAEQFKAAVPEPSGPTDWRGGLERMRRKAGQGRGPASLPINSDTAYARSARKMRPRNRFT